MPELVNRIEHALTTGLTHPGDGNGPVALPLPMFSNNTMPDEMARHFAEEAGLPHANVAKLVAEALVNLLENAGESGTAAAVRQVAETTPPSPVPAPTQTTTPTTPQPTLNIPAGTITITLNGETIITELADLQRFAADVQPGSRPPLWKKILIMAAIDGVTHQAFRRIDITTQEDGSWTMRATTV